VSEHDHETAFVRDEAFWNDRYRSASRVWSGQPNPQLVAEAAELAPGRALDAGCGEGADALWLAQRGWEVVATDISSVALERAAGHARDSDRTVAANIEWWHADLLLSPPEPAAFDLVSVQFMQLPPELRAQMFAGLAESVRPGGTLLIVGHHPSDMTSGVHRPPMPELFYTADDLAALLDGSWRILVNDSRPRSATTTDGLEATVHDAVLVASRRPAGGRTS
jgi:SAM-dependent methyltransferase